MSPAPKSPPPARAGRLAALVNARDVTSADAIKRTFISTPDALDRGRAMLKEAPMQMDFGMAPGLPMCPGRQTDPAQQNLNEN
jgi:hypothetical protein